MIVAAHDMGAIIDAGIAQVLAQHPDRLVAALHEHHLGRTPAESFNAYRAGTAEQIQPARANNDTL